MSKPDSEQLVQIRILVAEDNFANQRLTCAILEHAGYEAKVAVNGEETIKALETSPFDLVLMDCSMPIMNGFEATRSIRASDSRVLNRNIPIIALSAFTRNDYLQECRQAGMDDYVGKPIDPSNLIQTVEKYLQKPSWKQTVVADDELTPATVPQRSELAPEILDAIIELFMEDAPRQIAKLQAVLKSGDCAELQHISHQLRGSYEFLGTTSISSLAATVENASKRGELDQAVEIAKKLLQEMQKLHSKLADL